VGVGHVGAGSPRLPEGRAGAHRPRWSPVRRAALVLAALTIAALALAARADAYIYWTGLDTTTTFTDAVGRANLDGTDIRTDLITDPDIGSPVYGLAADGNHIYWTHNPFVSGSIGGANFDGSGANDNLIAPAGKPLIPAVAADGTHLYWVEGGGFDRPKIVRADVDSSGNVSGVGDFIGDVGTARAVIGMAVDDRYIYWANPSLGAIGRANLGDGGDVRPDLITGASLGGGTARIAGVAADNGYVYWANRGSATIGRANRDGTDVRQDFITGTSPALAVAVDDNYLYWANANTDAIGRAELPDVPDGNLTNVDQSFIQLPPGTGPVGLAVDSRPASCAGSAATIVGTGGSDTLQGTNGDDVIAGGGGDDTVTGLGGDDLICATPGADLIKAGGGDDVVRAGTGDDEVTGGGGDDELHGEGGEDTLRGGGGDDLHKGGAGDDELHGKGGEDSLRGGGGDDVHRGGGGDDRLRGGAGDDVHRGGGGKDDCRGGGGSDRRHHCE
jgi:Ca2+-binding RTX toxin-like protein